MGEVWLRSTGPMTVSAPAPVGGVAYNPYLKSSGDMGADPSTLPVSPRKALHGGPLLVDASLVQAMEPEAGRARGLRVKVLIDGTDRSEDLADDVRISEADGDAFPATTLKFHAPRYNYLRHASTDAGKDVVISVPVKHVGSGTVTDVKVFTGRTSSPNSGTYDPTEQRVEGLDGFLDRTKVHLSVRLDGDARGSVIARIGDEFEAVAQNNPTQILLQSGRCGLDGSTYNGNSGGSSDPRGGGGGLGGSGTTFYFDQPTDVMLDLTSFSGLTLGDEEKLGWKSIFISNPDPTQLASDDGPAAGACPLWTWEQLVPNMTITQADLRRVLIVTLQNNQRRISDVIRYLLERYGFTGGASFPTVNDDVLTSEMQFTGSLRQIIDDLAYLARWKRTRDGEGNLIFVLNQVKRLQAPYAADWIYTPGRWLKPGPRINGPELFEIPTGGLTVLGMNTVNEGREQWSETFKLTQKGEDPDPYPMAGAFLGGSYQEYATRAQGRLKTLREIERTHWFIGGKEVETLEEVWERRNPLNYKYSGLPGSRFGSTNEGSAEGGFPHLLDRSMLMLARRVRWRAKYYAGIFIGFERTIEERQNPPTYSPGGIGYDPVGGGYGGSGYGFLRDAELMETIAKDEVVITPTGYGFIASNVAKHYGLANPNVNYEAGRGGDGSNVASIGLHFDDEEKLILLLEEATTFRRRDWEWYERRDDKRQFRKKGGASAHGSIGFGGGYGTMGHVQSIVSAWDTEYQVLRGQPPHVESMEDRIRKTPVMYRLLSPSITADYGGDNAVDPLRPPYCQSEDQARRICHLEWSRRLSNHIVLSAPANPGLRRYQTVRYVWPQPRPDGRVLEVDGIVIFYDTTIPYRHGRSGKTNFTAEVDLYDLKSFLDGRAA